MLCVTLFTTHEWTPLKKWWWGGRGRRGGFEGVSSAFWNRCQSQCNAFWSEGKQKINKKICWFMYFIFFNLFSISLFFFYLLTSWPFAKFTDHILGGLRREGSKEGPRGSKVGVIIICPSDGNSNTISYHGSNK